MQCPGYRGAYDAAFRKARSRHGPKKTFVEVEGTWLREDSKRVSADRDELQDRLEQEKSNHQPVIVKTNHWLSHEKKKKGL